MSWIGTPPRDCWPTFSRQRCRTAPTISKPSWRKPGIVGEREAEVAGAHDGDAQLAIEAEDLPQVALQVADVVADAADAELAEVGEVLADLRGVEVELLGERLRRDGADAGVFERVEAAEVDRQAVGGELGDLIGALFARRLSRATDALFDCFTSAAADCNKNRMLISGPMATAAATTAAAAGQSPALSAVRAGRRSRRPSSRQGDRHRRRSSACCSARRPSTSACAPASPSAPRSRSPCWRSRC